MSIKSDGAKFIAGDAGQVSTSKKRYYTDIEKFSDKQKHNKITFAPFKRLIIY